MKKSRFSDSQISAVLKPAQIGTPLPELCRELQQHVCVAKHKQFPVQGLGRGWKRRQRVRFGSIAPLQT